MMTFHWLSSSWSVVKMPHVPFGAAEQPASEPITLSQTISLASTISTQPASAARMIMLIREPRPSSIITSRRASSVLTRSSAAILSSSVSALRALIFSFEIALVMLLTVPNAPEISDGRAASRLKGHISDTLRDAAEPRDDGHGRHRHGEITEIGRVVLQERQHLLLEVGRAEQRRKRVDIVEALGRGRDDDRPRDGGRLAEQRPHLGPEAVGLGIEGLQRRHRAQHRADKDD